MAVAPISVRLVSICVAASSTSCSLLLMAVAASCIFLLQAAYSASEMVATPRQRVRSPSFANNSRCCSVVS